MKNNKIVLLLAVVLLLVKAPVCAQQAKEAQGASSSVAATAQPPGESSNAKRQNADLEWEIDRLNAELKEMYAKHLKLLQDYQRMLKSPCPQKEELYVELGDAYIKAKLYAGAISAYEGALELNPRNAKAHFSLGLLYQQHLKDGPKALVHFKECLKSEPEFAQKGDAEYFIKMLEKNADFSDPK